MHKKLMAVAVVGALAAPTGTRFPEKQLAGLGI
jgi:hypothetical protein